MSKSKQNLFEMYFHWILKTRETIYGTSNDLLQSSPIDLFTMTYWMKAQHLSWQIQAAEFLQVPFS